MKNHEPEAHVEDLTLIWFRDWPTARRDGALGCKEVMGNREPKGHIEDLTFIRSRDRCFGCKGRFNINIHGLQKNFHWLEGQSVLIGDTSFRPYKTFTPRPGDLVVDTKGKKDKGMIEGVYGIRSDFAGESAFKIKKASEDGENEKLCYGLSSMQGWHASMEDVP
ncbi:hypothetical protein RJT34_16030 [Clitoria ternatea]|uniref:Uncharacterized protein n=1 Tax=Clitoria ternatea TaxID=43366 RepID=A0AAN9J6P0_CLITE